MVRLDFRLGSTPEELLHTLVPEVLYHPYSVYYRYTCSNQQHDWCLKLTSRLLPPPAHAESGSFTLPGTLQPRIGTCV
jgi:hypothetical protein